MKYTVVWTPPAERLLAELWLDAPDRDVVSAAAHEIDSRLKNDPEHQGESRSAGRRIFIVGLLVVIVGVRPADRVVTVLTVWRHER